MNAISNCQSEFFPKIISNISNVSKFHNIFKANILIKSRMH